jgi:hypothetical protein
MTIVESIKQGQKVMTEQPTSEIAALEEAFLFLLVAGRLLDSGEWPRESSDEPESK